MRTCIQQSRLRSSRRLLPLAAAAAGLVSRPAVAEGPIAPPPIHGAPPTHHVQSSYETWLGFTAQGAIRDPVYTFIDLVAGFHADMHPADLTVRPAIGVKFPYGFSAFAGYAYSTFWDTHHQRGDEHTILEQVSYQAPFTAVQLHGRVRLEQRFRPSSDVGHRLRGLVQLNVPFWHLAPVQLEVSDEIFLGLNQPAKWQPELFDADLFFVGLGWGPNPHFLAEAGYQGAVVPRKDVTEIVHALSLSSTVTW